MASTKDDRILNGKGLAEVWAQTKSKDASILEQAKAYTDQVALEGTVDLSGYATEDWVNNKGYDTVSNVDTKIAAAKADLNSAITTKVGEEATARAAAVTGEQTAREAAISALDTRLQKTEAFFVTTDGQTIDTALDTLVEIQEYLEGEGADTDQLLTDVATLRDQMDFLTTADIQAICS